MKQKKNIFLSFDPALSLKVQSEIRLVINEVFMFLKLIYQINT